MMHGKGRLCFVTFHERKWIVRVAAFVVNVYLSRDIDIWFLQSRYSVLQLDSEQMNEPCVLFRWTYLRLASNHLKLNFNTIFS